MNWSKGIIVAFVLFALLMISFLIRSIINGGEKVPDKYYEKGNKYQEILDEEKGVHVFAPKILYNTQQESFELRFDSIKPDSGLLTMHWPPNEGKSIKWPFVYDGKGMLIPCKDPKGSWNGELVFYHQGKKYYFREKVWVP